MEPVHDPTAIEPWVGRLIAAQDPHERDAILLSATQDLCGPAALWREDEAGEWHEIAGSNIADVNAQQVAAIASGAMAMSLPMAQVVIGGADDGRRAVVLESSVEPELAEGLLVLATLCAEPGGAPLTILDLFQGPLPSDGDEPCSEDSPEWTAEGHSTRPTGDGREA